MLGKRFRKGFVSDAKRWKKCFFKVKNNNKNAFLVNMNSFTGMINQIGLASKKTRQWYLRKINRSFLFRDFHGLLDKELACVSENNPIGFAFKKYTSAIFVSQGFGKLCDFHMEMLRKSIKKFLSKKSFIFLRLRPYKVMLKRASQIRMGGGKASKIDKVYYPVFPGCVVFELKGVSYSNCFNALSTLTSKLPIKLKVFFCNYI
jgi:ribosomal protein L16/L10AE